MPAKYFTQVRTWVFDLDNTLYDPSINLFSQIEVHMNRFIIQHVGVDAAEAAELRDRYWRDHGTTLAGLMTHHGVDPDHFLDEVHQIDLDALSPDPDLGEAISALPGRKIIFTNGSRAHARQVTRAKEIEHHFDAIYGVEDAGYVPKPKPTAFHRVFESEGLDHGRAAMFEDDPRNLKVPHDLGMRTVLVGPPDAQDHIHHQTQDLSGFLSQVR